MSCPQTASGALGRKPWIFRRLRHAATMTAEKRGLERDSSGAALTGLAGALERAGCDALLIVAESSRDPDLAPFIGDVHLGDSFLLVRPPASPRLGFLTRMERDEAAGTGCSLLDPEELGVRELTEADNPPGEFWGELLDK